MFWVVSCCHGAVSQLRYWRLKLRQRFEGLDSRCSERKRPNQSATPSEGANGARGLGGASRWAQEVSNAPPLRPARFDDSFRGPFPCRPCRILTVNVTTSPYCGVRLTSSGG